MPRLLSAIHSVENTVACSTGSPFQVRVTDRSVVTLLDDLTDLRDDRDLICLPYDLPSTFNFDVSQAGPGECKERRTPF